MELKCDNCENPIKQNNVALIITNWPKKEVGLPETLFAARICDDCVKDVTVLKIVLKHDNGKYQFEQYLPVECKK